MRDVSKIARENRMTTIILAAGEGRRLRPHTTDKPKCMVELAGKPILHHQLDILQSCGIDDCVIVGGYKVDALRAGGNRVVKNVDYATTNMVASLFCAERLMTPDEDVLIIYGDILFGANALISLMKLDSQVAVSINTRWRELWEERMSDPLSDVESLRVSEDRRIIEIGKKAHSLDQIDGQYMGLIKIKKEFVETLKKQWWQLKSENAASAEGIYMTAFLQRLIDDNYEIKADFVNGGWLEVDTSDDLNLYRRMFHDGTLRRFIEL